MTAPDQAPKPTYHRHYPDGQVFADKPGETCPFDEVTGRQPVVVIAAGDTAAIKALMRAYDAHGGNGLRSMRDAINELTGQENQS